MNTQEYFEGLNENIKRNYEIAEFARQKGFDPQKKVEVPLAMTMAAKVIKLIATVYPQLDNELVISRLLELEKIYGALEPGVSIKIAEEVALQKFCTFKDQLQAIEAGIRVGIAYTTLGVVSSPIEGFTEIKVAKTHDGKDYFKVYFAGPMRSAGGTGAAFSLVIADYLREYFGYHKYDPTEEEVKRMVMETSDYHERITNLQYFPTEEEMIFLARNIPVQVTGDPSEKLEVSNFKDLPRIETNMIRGGFCLVFAEGLAQKAPKILRMIGKLKKNGFKLSDWEFLEGYVELHKKRTSGSKDTVATYIKDLVAGRPVYGHPGRSGGFRFRYGRGNTAGFSAASIHPATMGVTNGFLATGTQLKIEKPTKGCIVMPCDSIDGPIVKLKNGSVKKVLTLEEGKKLYNNIEEIIYLGDILFPLGDVMNRNSVLLKAGYVEEWWDLELKEKGFDLKSEELDKFNIDLEKAIFLSEKYSVPLHPHYIFYWTQISYEEFLGLVDWLQHGTVSDKIILPYNKNDRERFQKGKRALELLGIDHEVTIENVIISGDFSKSLLINLGFDKNFIGVLEFSFDFSNVGGSVLEIINKMSKFIIKDKAGEFIGTRMGRPEKAKLRKLTGSPSVLFSVGEEGGRLRSIQEACNLNKINAEFPTYFCEICNKETIYKYCLDCKEPTVKRYFCFECNKILINNKCEVHGRDLVPFREQTIPIKEYLQEAQEHLKISTNELPNLIKGIRGTSSNEHITENLAKGILRAKYGLTVNKDGTIRYDMTEMPITHFKPKEVETSVEKLKILGYEKDVFGNELVSDEQILELKPHDIILPCNVEAGDEKGDDVFMNIANFLDELLVKFYGMEPFYKIKKRGDLVGQLTACMAPHNCAGVISRIIGFSKVQGLLASPYMHAAMRRDCDGDEAAIMMLLDVLINFSREYLPGHRGGTQDAPLVLNGRINAGEVDDQILDFELVWSYPLELYRFAEEGKHSSEMKIETVKQRIAKSEDPFSGIGFTHNSDNLNAGINCSIYKLIPTMQEKVDAQMDLAKKLRAVDQGDVARLIIERHFIRDIRGNLRKFSQQVFRCVKCNTKFRRPPLEGKCFKCGGKIIFTINEGGIVKYVEPALKLIQDYDVPPYVKQNVEMTKKYIESVFGKEKEKQVGLGQFL